MTDTSVISHAATIVTAYLGNHKVSPAEVPAVIAAVHSALGALAQPVSALVVPAKLVPMVSVRKSVQPHAVTCLECGFAGQMIRRHLTAAHGLTVDAYRAKWGLQADYPVVAPNYAVRRSALAKQIGLGTVGRGRLPRRAATQLGAP